MKKRTIKDFNIFKSECNKLLKEYGLNNYTVVYQFGGIEDRAASSLTDSSAYNATLALGDKYEDRVDRQMTNVEFIKQLAKHEVLHVLLGRFSMYACSNDYTLQDKEDAEEELVARLINIIK